MANIIVDTDTTPKHSALTPKLSVAFLAALLQKNYSQSDIARYFSVTPQAVNQFIEYHREELEPFLNYDNIMAVNYKLKAYKIVNAIEERDIKKASLQQKMTSAAIATEKSRLLEGLSTSNEDIHVRIIETASKSLFANNPGPSKVGVDDKNTGDNDPETQD